MDRSRGFRILVAALLLGAIAAPLAYRAFGSPAAQFLRPSRQGSWIVHPELPIPGYQHVEFLRRFALSELPVAYPVHFTAMRELEIAVNQQTLPRIAHQNWKRSTTLDLAGHLRHGENEIRVKVRNWWSPPALLVEGPEAIRSDPTWTVAAPPDDPAERAAALVFRDERFLQPRPNELRSSPYFPYWAALFSAYVLFLLYAVSPRPTAAAAEYCRTPPAAPAWNAGRILCLALFAAVALIHLRNVWFYPTTRGFDPIQHADYVRFVAEHWIVPDASQGWQMSQPPLYYFVAAVVYLLFGGAAHPIVAWKAVQTMSPLAMLGVIGLTWRLLVMLFPAKPGVHVLGLAVAAFLPVGFYIGPQVTNEVFAALAIDVALVAAVAQALRHDERWSRAAWIGVACGLALLSKYTGLFVLLSVLCLAGLRVFSADGTRLRTRLRRLGWATVILAIAAGLSGWLYARNAAKFGDPFIGAWDRKSGFNIVQEPGYRTIGFFTRFGSVFWHEPGRSRNASFLDGIYGSMWADSHAMFVNPDHEQRRRLTLVVLCLALLPTIAIALGFAQAARHLLVRDWDHPFLPLVLTTVLTVAGMISFALQTPFYSAIKAHYALSLTPCAGVFAAMGLETMGRRLGRGRWLLYANLAVLGSLVPVLFWYQPK